MSGSHAYTRALQLQQIGSGTGIERSSSGDHLIDDNGHRVDVARCGHSFAPQLLGRHVVQSSDRRPGCCRLQVLHLRNSEIDNDYVIATSLEQDVLRFQVAMENALLMHVLERVSHLLHYRLYTFQIHSLVLNTRAQRFTVYVLHHDIRFAITQVATIEHPNNSGMIDLPERCYFLIKSSARIPILDQQRRQNLDHDWLIAKPPVERPINLTHAAAAQFAFDKIAFANRFPDQFIGWIDFENRRVLENAGHCIGPDERENLAHAIFITGAFLGHECTALIVG